MATEIAVDFRAEVYADEGPCEEPASARILMSGSELVAAFPDGEVRIDHSDVLDVVVDQPPVDIDIADTTLTIAYEGFTGTLTLVIGAPSDRIDGSRQALFESLLDGTLVCVKHPARVGGRVVDAPVHPATLRLREGRLAFRHEGGRDAIDVADVIDFDRQRRRLTPSGDRIPVVGVRQFTDGRARTSFIGIRNGRELNLVGRYLRTEYADLRAEVRDIDLERAEVEALVALYSGNSATDLAPTLDAEPGTVEELLAGLEEEGLIAPGGSASGYTLTDRGRVVVNHRLQSVNS